MPRERVWSGGHDARLQAWDLQALELVETFDLGGSVTSIALRPVDGLLAVGTVGAGISVRRDGPGGAPPRP